MTDPLLKFVANSSNFGYLAPHSLELAGDGAAAEAYIDIDPDAALARARRFGETLIDLALTHLGLSAYQDGKRKTFAERIGLLTRAGTLPTHLADEAELIRKQGNAAVHDYLGSRTTAERVVRACFDLGQWWHRLATGQPTDLAYTRQASQAASPELLERLDRQLRRLRAERDARGPVVTIGPRAPDPYRWRAGSIVADAYVVHEPVTRFAAGDGSWTVLDANGRGLDRQAKPVRLRAVHTDGSRTSGRMVEGLDAQAAYLKAGKRLLAHRAEGSFHLLVAAVPADSTWRAAFGGGDQALDVLVLPLVIEAGAAVADALADLHRAGTAHRSLDGDSILVMRGWRRGVLRDLGLAWWPRLREEGGANRAPEQRAAALGQVGPAADVYQLAALLRHTCAGIRHPAGHLPPLSLLLSGFPAALDELLARALATDPAQRPDATAFAAGLRQGRASMTTGAVHGHP